MVFAEGRRFSSKGMRIHVLRTQRGRTRAVFVPVRSYPSAVARNRARRVARECWRLRKDRLLPGFDVAVVLYPGVEKGCERGPQLERLLGQAGILA